MAIGLYLKHGSGQTFGRHHGRVARLVLLGKGMYLRQEGRGIGLTNKIRAYALQDRGLDTVDANLALGFRDDERDYAVAAHMLASLNVESVQLMTNNPKKIRGLEQHGIVVSSRLPHVMPANDHDRFYLQTKAHRSGHLLEDQPRLPDQDEPLRLEPDAR